MGTTYPSDPVCRDCGDKDADCLTSDRVRVCVSCLHERAANERDALRLEVAGLAREVVDLRKARFRGDVCGACGKPTSVGESFDGPCPHDTDLACALWQRDEARAEVLRCHDSLREADRVLRQAHAERDEARVEVERLRDLVCVARELVSKEWFRLVDNNDGNSGEVFREATAVLAQLTEASGECDEVRAGVEWLRAEEAK